MVQYISKSLSICHIISALILFQLGRCWQEMKIGPRVYYAHRDAPSKCAVHRNRWEEQENGAWTEQEEGSPSEGTGIWSMLYSLSFWWQTLRFHYKNTSQVKGGIADLAWFLGAADLQQCLNLGNMISLKTSWKMILLVLCVKNHQNMSNKFSWSIFTAFHPILAPSKHIVIIIYY